MAQHAFGPLEPSSLTKGGLTRFRLQTLDFCRHVAKLRLNSLFAGSTEGAHRAATLLGVAATCRSLGVDTVAYLVWAFTRLGTHRDVYGLSAAELTPAAFAQTRAGPKTS